MSVQNNDFLAREPIGRLLFKLAVPTVLAQLINMLYNIVDRIYIGHMAENAALALTGVGVCMPLILIVTAFAALIASGGAPRASMAMGRHDRSAAEQILGNSFVFQLIISLLLTIGLLAFNRPLLLAFGASANTIEYAVSYMSIYACGTLFVQLTLGMNAFITAQGFTQISMRTVLIGAIANIILDPLLIYGLDMGVQGAALATIIAQALSCLWVLSFLFGKRTLLKLRRINMRLQISVLLPCLALGLAPFIMTASESIIAICYNSTLLQYGGDVAVGTMTILSSVMQFAMLPLQGLGQGAQPIMSYNFGQGNPQRVKKTFKLLMLVSLTYSTLLWLLIMIFPQGFIRIFTADPTLAAFAQTAFRIYFFALLIFGAQVACQMTLIAIGNAKASIAVAILRKFVLLIPLIYIMPRLFDAQAVLAIYASEPAADILAVAFTLTLFTVQFKKALRQMSARPILNPRAVTMD